LVQCTLTTLKKIGEWNSVQQRINVGARELFNARMMFSQLLVVTDGVLKLDYASVTFVDLGV